MGVDNHSPPSPRTWDQDTTGYGRQAGGMHPTGMLVCFAKNN